MVNRYGYIINSDGTTAPLSDPHALHRGESVARAEVAANAEMLGGMLPSEFAKAGETGGVTMELLWENASPTSGFSAQTLSLPLPEGSYIAIEGRASTQGNREWIFLKTGQQTVMKTFALGNAKEIYMRSRSAQTSTTGVTFGAGNAVDILQSSVSGNDNDTNAIVPLAIYMLKGVS